MKYEDFAHETGTWPAVLTEPDPPRIGCAARPRPEEMSQEELTELETRRERARRLARDSVDVEERGGVLPASRTGRRAVREVLAQALAELQVRHEHGVNGFSTGISSLDGYTRRALQPGRVICVAADTKGGKTALTGQLLVALAAQGVPSLLGSFEDATEDTVLRWLSNLSSGNVGVIRDGFTRPDGSKLPIPADFDTAVDKLAALDIELMAQSGTVEAIAGEVAHWWAEKRSGGAQFGAVLLDQLSHIIPSDRAAFSRRFPGYPPPPHRDNTVAMLEWQVGILTMLARKQNLLIIVCHQLNTQHKEWEKPSQRSLRGSQGIAHKVDALLIPWRPSKLRNDARGMGEAEYVPNVDDRAWILCPIGRQVQPFEVEVAWHGSHQRFADLDAQNRAPWVAPAALSASAATGLAKLAALKNAWAASNDAVAAAANGVRHVPEIPAAPAELPRLATAPAGTVVDDECMAPPGPPLVSPSAACNQRGFGGGGRAVVRSMFDDLL